MAKYIKKKKTLRQRTTNPETSDIRENKIILIKKGNYNKRRKSFFSKQNNEKNNPISCSKKNDNNEALRKNTSEEDKISKEEGEEMQNSRILIYVEEIKDGESINNQEDISSENFMNFPDNYNNIENSFNEKDFAHAEQVQFNGPNRENQ